MLITPSSEILTMCCRQEFVTITTTIAAYLAIQKISLTLKSKFSLREASL